MKKLKDIYTEAKKLILQLCNKEKSRTRIAFCAVLLWYVFIFYTFPFSKVTTWDQSTVVTDRYGAPNPAIGNLEKQLY